MLTASSRIAFSAGSGSMDPYGYREMSAGSSPLEELAKQDGTLVPWLFCTTPLMINAYPATIDPVPGVSYTDTYLSVTTGTRALELAALESASAVLVGQPLFIAELLLRHRQRGAPFPPRLLLAIGGYPLPTSLLGALRDWTHGIDLRVAQFYGIAEVDAACLVAANPTSPVIWHARRDIDVQIDDEGYLLLRRKDATEYRPTGDRAHYVAGGLVVETTRVGTATAEELERWSTRQWEQQTGYRSEGTWIPRSTTPNVDWTRKPDWR